MMPKALLITSLAILLLLVRIVLYFTHQPVLFPGEVIHGETTLLTDPQTLHGSQLIKISIGDSLGSVLVNAQLPSSPVVTYGQHIRYSGTVKTRLTSDKRTVYTVYVKQMKVVDDGTPFLLLLSSFRQRSLDSFFQALPRPEAELLAGMIFGRRPQFSSTLTTDMQISGVTHVVAASGMNVTFVIAFLSSIFGLLFSRRLATVLSLLGIGGYVVLAGLQPSIMRAGIMGSGMLIATLLGRQYTAWYWLLLCVVFMVFTEPSLIFDIGFQLSVMATLGLFTVKPLFHLPKVFDDMSTTTSAQIMTLPILLTAFGSIGGLSIIVNFLVLWMIAPLMVIGVVGAFISLITPPIGSLIILLAHPLLWIFLSLIQWFGNLGVVWKVIEVPWEVVVGYYLLVGSMIVILHKNNA